jgi:hypothetical protein
MNIRDILLIIIIIYLIISHSKKNNIENFAVTDDIRAAVKEIYNTDMEAVRQLDIISKEFIAGGLKAPGNVKITGNLGTTGNLEVTGAFNLLPKGTIVAFNSTSAPYGWTLCDGSNGSPDLRGKFIRMWNDNTGNFDGNGAKVYDTAIEGTYNAAWPGNNREDTRGYILKHKFGSYAGSDLHHQNAGEIASHTHTGTTSNSGNHSHGMGGDIDSSMAGSSYKQMSKRDRSGQNTDGAGDHSHTFTTAASGLGWGISKLPPYYVLTWIMKL